jgi:integrase
VLHVGKYLEFSGTLFFFYIDLKALTIYVRGGKGGKDGLVFITDDCAKALRRYLEVRAPMSTPG